MGSARNIIVLGGSAGAAAALDELLSKLPADLPATLFVTLHVSPLSREWLSEKLSRKSGMHVVSPLHDQRTQPGCVYVARPDYHLIVKEGRVLSHRGPRENLWRPAIDVLFRTAAVAYGNRVIGILVSGELDDGTAGLQAIKLCGGLTIVQDPHDAANPALPAAALSNVSIDHLVPLREMPALLQRLVTEVVPEAVPIPEELRAEARIAAMSDAAPKLTDRVRDAPTSLSCPECSGPLWAHEPDESRFRCLVGHAFHLDALLEGAEDELERTLWAAIRQFEQRVNIARMMAVREREQGREQRAALYDTRAAESHAHAQRLRELLRRSRYDNGALEPEARPERVEE